MLLTTEQELVKYMLEQYPGSSQALRHDVEILRYENHRLKREMEAMRRNSQDPQI